MYMRFGGSHVSASANSTFIEKFLNFFVEHVFLLGMVPCGMNVLGTKLKLLFDANNLELHERCSA